MKEHPFNIKKVESCNDTTTTHSFDHLESQVKLVLVTDNDEKLTLLFSQDAVHQMKPHCKTFESCPT